MSNHKNKVLTADERVEQQLNLWRLQRAAAQAAIDESMAKWCAIGTAIFVPLFFVLLFLDHVGVLHIH